MKKRVLTATEYQARLLRERGIPAVAFRRICEDQLKQSGVSVLSDFAEETRWLELVETLSFSNKKAWAIACREAFKTMLLYEIPIARLTAFKEEKVQLFRGFLQGFLQKEQPTFLEALGGLDLSDQGFELFGFVDFPPLYQKLFSGPEFSKTELNEAKIEVYVSQAQTAESEFLAALQAIEHLWQASPRQTFALVVQPSELSWKVIHRLLKSRTSPMKISCAKGQAVVDTPQFNFIRDFFETFTSQDLTLMSRVLVSPFWGEDTARRLMLDDTLRENILRVTSLPQVLKYLLYIDPTVQEAKWFQAWMKFINFDPAEACHFIETFLQAAEFVSLPEEKVKQADLHIVSALEAASLPVDVVWLLAADRTHYPRPQGSPLFLPKVLLAEYGVPIGIEAQYHYGANLLHAITHGKTVYASFVSEVRGEKRQLSRGLVSIAAPAMQAVPLSPASQLGFALYPESEWREEEQDNIPLSQAEMLTMKGGSRLLKEQAECPFKAFAHFRLDVKAQAPGQDVLSPMQKGQLVHTVLEKIWLQLGSQQALLALMPEGRAELIATKVDETLRESHIPMRRPLIRQLERQRLIDLIAAWLQLEAKRPPFRVLASEVKEMIGLGGLPFRLRMDRIDEIEGGRLIIDYKTGEISEKGWFDERLSDPQLPLYVAKNKAIGAAFGSLKVGKMDFVGIIAREDAAFQRVRPLRDASWESQTATWQSQLEHLATEFKEGRLDVAPIHEKACLYCDLSPLCRIKEKPRT